MAKAKDDVEGRCPRCGYVVAVYAMGSHLRVRAHTHNVNNGTGWRSVPCLVTGVDGADALARTMAQMDSGVQSASRDVASAEAALAKAQDRAAVAREQRDEYAAKVAAIKARAGGKGGAR